MEITRRHMLRAGASALAIAPSRRAFAGWEQSDCYPDPAVQVLDPSFAKYRLTKAARLSRTRR